MSPKDNATRISIIIATYNRGPILLDTLGSLVHQTLPADKWEAVVVNNNSTDDTEEIFRQFMAGMGSGLNIRMVFEGKQGLSNARNRGITESSGDIIAIIDDDETVNQGFAEQYLTFFDSHPDAAAGGGKITPQYDFDLPDWWTKYTEKPIAGTFDMGPEVRLFTGNRYPFGGNMALRRSTIERFGIFDPELGRTGKKLLAGEEKDLFRRIQKGGGKIYWVPGPEIHHIIPQKRTTRDYLVQVSSMIGVSEKRRTLGKSSLTYAGRLLSETVKWAGTLVLAAGYLLKGHPSKGGYLLLMRWHITKGLTGMVPDNP